MTTTPLAAMNCKCQTYYFSSCIKLCYHLLIKSRKKIRPPPKLHHFFSPPPPQNSSNFFFAPTGNAAIFFTPTPIDPGGGASLIIDEASLNLPVSPSVMNKKTMIFKVSLILGIVQSILCLKGRYHSSIVIPWVS